MDNEQELYSYVGQLYLNLMSNIQKITRERNELSGQLERFNHQLEELKGENALLRNKIRELTNGNMGT